MKFEELSLNILDVALNSVRAGALLIEISVTASTESNRLVIEIKDNGVGFDVNRYEKETAERLRRDSAQEKSGGNGLRLFKESAEKTGGSFELVSEKGSGTYVKAEYILNSPIRAPLGDMAETFAALTLCEGDRDIVYTCNADGKGFTLNTAQIKELYGDAPWKNYGTIKFIKDFIKENTDNINKNRFF